MQQRCCIPKYNSATAVIAHQSLSKTSSPSRRHLMLSQFWPSLRLAENWLECQLELLLAHTLCPSHPRFSAGPPSTAVSCPLPLAFRLFRQINVSRCVCHCHACDHYHSSCLLCCYVGCPCPDCACSSPSPCPCPFDENPACLWSS